jgi:hypothetical protein
MSQGSPHTPDALRAVVADPPGEQTTLTLYDQSGALASIALDPASAAALARDLLDAACQRRGRDRERTADWGRAYAGRRKPGH